MIEIFTVATFIAHKFPVRYDFNCPLLFSALSMSSKKRLPTRVHGQRISPDALVIESRAAMERTGIANYLRAEFYAELAKIVVNNPEPLFSHYQPQVKSSNFALQNWTDAYTLVSQFLEENHLELTRVTANLELPWFITRRSSPWPLSSEATIRRLMTSSDHGEDFDDRVRRHSKAGSRSNSSATPPPSPVVESPKHKSGSPRKLVRKRKVVPEEKGTPSKKIRVRTSSRQSPKQQPTPKKGSVDHDTESSMGLIDDDI
jgi:hypothetical protein